MKSKNLRKRTAISFAGLLVFYIATIGVGYWIHHQPQEDNAPWILRRGLEFTDRVGEAIFRQNHPTRTPPAPVKGTKPRFNGDLGLAGNVDPNLWRMEIANDPPSPMNAEPLILSLADFKTLPRTSSTTDFFCIEGWKDTFNYSGVKFSDFLDRYHLGKRPGSEDYYAYVGLETPDGEYYVSIDMQSMLHPQTLLADEMNEEPLSPRNGAPLRLIIPIKYGIKSLKRIGKITFSDQRPPDYWHEQGYDWFAGL